MSFQSIRMYLKKALDFHVPKALIWASDMPLKAAQDAAPMRKTVRFIPRHIQITKTKGIG